MKHNIFTSKTWFQVRMVSWKVTCILVAFTRLLPGFVNVIDAAAAEPGIKGMRPGSRPSPSTRATATIPRED